MGHTNRTPNVRLPQFVESDKPTWLGDVNETNTRIEAEFNAQRIEIENLKTALAAHILTGGGA